MGRVRGVVLLTGLTFAALAITGCASVEALEYQASLAVAQEATVTPAAELPASLTNAWQL